MPINPSESSGNSFLRPKVYVLALDNGCYYVGKCTNFPVRIKRHIQGNGSLWTKRHRPLRSEALFWGEEEEEKSVFLEYLDKYGIKKVRGWVFCKDGDYDPIDFQSFINALDEPIEFSELTSPKWFKPMKLERDQEWIKNSADKDYTIWESAPPY